MSKLTHEQIFGAFARTTVSMEENDLNINIQAEHEGEQVDEDQVPLDTSDAPEAAELDVADAIDETEEELDGADDVVDVVESLESLRCSLEAIQEQGVEFTPAAALLTQVAVDNAVSRLPGLSASAIGVPSMEDFDYAPATSLTVSIEKIGETISAGFKASGDFIKKIWGKIKTFFIRIFDAAKGAKMKNDSIVKQLDGIDGSATAGDATVTVPGLVGALNVRSVNNTLEVIKTINNSPVKIVDASMTAMAGEDKSTITNIFNNGLTKLNGKVYPFGGMAFSIEQGKVISVTSSAGGDAKAEKVPSLQELKSLAAANGNLIDVLIDIRKQEGRHKKVNETMTALNGKILNLRARKTENAELTKTMSSNANTAVSAYNQRVSFELNVIGKALSAANALNNVLASAASKYKKAS